MLKEKGLPQEGLKIIACVTMLLDHIGAVLVPLTALRVIGRIAFPIYCFLLAEGVARTRDVKKYGIRLAIGALLSEVPFDLALYGQISWAHQSVMVTLLLGYLVILSMNQKPMLAPFVFVVCMGAAELLGTDYGALGVLMMVFFAENREWKWWLRILALAMICWLIGGAGWQLGPFVVPLQLVGVVAMVPIGLYNGRKVTGSRAVQWGFYLFYPAHLLVLWIIQQL